NRLSVVGFLLSEARRRGPDNGQPTTDNSNTANHPIQGEPMVAIRFTGNYEDLSTDRGYQFKFFCEKCNNGYMSSFQTSTVGMLGSAARVAGSLFGGVFSSVADSS